MLWEHKAPPPSSRLPVLQLKGTAIDSGIFIKLAQNGWVVTAWNQERKKRALWYRLGGRDYIQTYLLVDREHQEAPSHQLCQLHPRQKENKNGDWVTFAKAEHSICQGTLLDKLSSHSPLFWYDQHAWFDETNGPKQGTKCSYSKEKKVQQTPHKQISCNTYNIPQDSLHKMTSLFCYFLMMEIVDMQRVCMETFLLWQQLKACIPYNSYFPFLFISFLGLLLRPYLQWISPADWLTLAPLGPGKPITPGWPRAPCGPGGPGRPSSPGAP